jgi:hypothetical protein
LGARVDGVADEVAALLEAAGRSESEREPEYPRSGWMPPASRRLRVPTALAARRGVSGRLTMLLGHPRSDSFGDVGTSMTSTGVR